jgi:hypothetical protein
LKLFLVLQPLRKWTFLLHGEKFLGKTAVVENLLLSLEIVLEFLVFKVYSIWLKRWA